MPLSSSSSTSLPEDTSMESSRSSSLLELEKMTPPGSPRTPATAFATASGPNLPSWVPTQTIPTIQAGVRQAQVLCRQAQAKFGPQLQNSYHSVAAHLPPASAIVVPMRFRRLLHPYTVMFFALFIIANIGLFGHHSNPPPYHSRPKNWQPPVGLTKVHADFPHKIWQTWKVNPLEFEERDHNTAHSWVARNPDYRYEVLTDRNELSYVEYHYGPEGFNRPDIVDFYRNVRATIVRADLLRYMIMYADGGVYADIDVESIKPMSKFVPERYNKRDIDMVIGVEIDEPDWKDHPILGQKSRSFCQWTFMSKPQNPIMMTLIEQIMTWLHGVAEKQKVSISEVVLDFDEIITGTGPSAFTNAILKHINKDRPAGDQVTWDYFHDMSESRLVGGVLVLTVEAFAAGQGHSDSGNHDARAALVRHHYHASNWPSRHPRYSHPVYGEVEKCNWRDDCVHQWDEDVAAFKQLSESEQQRLIEEHEREEREKEEREREEMKKQEDEERANREREEEEARQRQAEEERRKEEESRKEEEDRKKENKEEKENKEDKGGNNQEAQAN